MKPKVLILTPTYDGNVHVAYLISIIEAMKDCDVELIFNKGSLLTLNRNKMFLNAIKLKTEYILFLDADVSIKNSQWLIKMINKLDEINTDILSGIVPMKSNIQKASIAYDYGDFKVSLYPYQEIQSLPELFPIHLAATGCLLIKIGKWFEKMEPPYFHIEDAVIDSEARVFSEDWYFCRKARNAGAKIFAWRGLEIEHYGSNSWSNKEIVK